MSETLEEPLFDPSLKKKKKKKPVAFEIDPLGVDGGASPPTYADDTPATEDPAPLNGATGDVDFSDLKKKKKSKKAVFDIDDLEGGGEASGSAPKPSADSESAPAEASLGEFADMKKKKKKKSAFDLEAFEKELEETSKAAPAAEAAAEDAEDTAAVADYDEAELGEDVFAAPTAGGVESSVTTHAETWHGTDRDYTYDELLGRIMKTLHAQNPDLSLGGRKRQTIVPPSVHREGNKKTIFANIAEICKRMHRSPEHVIQFIFAELGTTGSVDGEKRLVIKGRFQPKQIENVLRRYIVEYVTCKTCKSFETILSKENRLYFMTCESCGSKRSVSAIKTGFQAQIGKRKKAVT